MEEKCLSTSNCSQSMSSSTSLPSTESAEVIIARNTYHLLDQPHPPPSEPTTSRAGSMSRLQEDDFCVSNSQHDFSEALDDEETSTSGVLETYEISSSNSLPTDLEIPVDLVGVDDSSRSTHDTLKDEDVPEPSDIPRNPSIFNSSEVFIINDEDDEDDRNDGVDAVDDGDHIDNTNTSQLAELGDSCNMQGELNGVIMAADGSKVFLETPVVEEQQLHHLVQIANLGGRNDEYIEMAGKPKRLSDEFMLEENVDTIGDDDAQPSSTKSAQFDKCVFKIIENESSDLTGIKTEPRSDDNCPLESSHDRMMSFHLKKMSLTNSNACVKESAMNDLAALPSSSQLVNNVASLADIDSMDLIERTDFETEQRLTGGIILKSSSVADKNIFNLSLLKTCKNQQKMHEAGAQAKAGLYDNDDWPSSSCSRAVSSDSKCAYKDGSSTPTSSRKHNSRLTKSTAKINLCSSLSHSQLSEDILRPQRTKLSSSPPAQTATIGSLKIIDPMPSSSTSSISESSAAGGTSSARTDDYTNSNSNDNYTDAVVGTSCQQNDTDEPPSSSSSSFAALGQMPETEGCSRTNALNAFSLSYDDNQPSTSSARCQYAPTQVKNSRQVNASAQTNERYLSRASLPGLGAGCSNLSSFNCRNRRRTENSNHTQRNGTDDVILVEVVVGDSVNDSDMVDRGDFNVEDSWADCDEENNCSDLEEICTCQNSTLGGSSHGGSNSSLNETVDLDGCDPYISEEASQITDPMPVVLASSSVASLQQRKRKYNDGRLLDNDYCLSAAGGSPGSALSDNNCRKRIAYDFSSTTTPRSSLTASTTQTVPFGCVPTSVLTGSPIGRRTPRSLIPTRDNPPPELQHWLGQFQRWSHAERLVALDRMIDHCNPSQVRHMMKVIEPQFQRDFISLLPRELALSVLSYLEPKDLLQAAQTCRSWRFLCDDNLLWKEKCRKSQILSEPRSDRPKRGRAGNMPPISSPWKAAYMRQHIIEMNWRSRSIRKPKVLKGHDDHVITCLQFWGNRIVSGSDDNTLKVWSAVTGRCLRTLVGHTGGVWSSQMSGNIIISGSTDRTLKVWDMETGHCVHTLQGHTSTVRCMHLHGNKVVSGSRDATLRVWDIDQGTCLHVLVGHLAAVRCVQYDGKLIVSGAYDYMVKIWHPERQECLHTLQGHTNRVYSLQFDGVHVVSGSLDTSIRVWDVETGNCKHTLMGHQSLTSGMELRHNILVSGNADSTVKVWDITTGQCLQTLSGPNKHQSAVTCLQFNSRFVVTSSDDGTVKLWDVKTGEFIRNLVALESGGSGGVVWRIRANDTKLICAVGSRNGTEETKLMVLDFDVEGACVKCS